MDDTIVADHFIEHLRSITIQELDCVGIAIGEVLDRRILGRNI